jgi:hypothetical protein
VDVRQNSSLERYGIGICCKATLCSAYSHAACFRRRVGVQVGNLQPEPLSDEMRGVSGLIVLKF